VGTCMKLLCKMHFIYQYQNDLIRIHVLIRAGVP